MRRPAIDWPFARAVARRAAGTLPPITRVEAMRTAADLRLTARRAGEIVANHVGVPGVGAKTVAIVDWEGWARAIESMAEMLLEDVPWQGATATRRIRSLGSGAIAGLVLGKISTKLLGQYDGLISDTLYLVAPTVVEHERRLGLIPADFRLWVSLHEQTHAAQFACAPWLRTFLLDSFALLLEDEASLLEGLRSWAETRDLTSLTTSRSAQGTLSALTAAMTFLEGHADYVADSVGRNYIPTIAALRRTFDRSGPPNLLARLASSLDKTAQYRDGFAFCCAVTEMCGQDALASVFTSPETLPTVAELADPPAWIERIHG